jgi:putative tricarboxylic transport membrane protein
LLIGFVLGPLVEDNLRRALTISQGELGILVASPVSRTVFVLIGVLCLVVCVTSWRRLRRQRQ